MASTAPHAAVHAEITKLLSLADIQLNGDRPWDLQLNDTRLFDRVLAEGSLGFGEAYMDGWWDCEALDQLIFRAYTADIKRQLRPWRLASHVIKARLLNRQTLRGALTVGRRHYDIGNDLFSAMLDPRMIYSCAYWARAETLADAQEHKLALVANKLMLQPGMRVLDIGCGWGGAAQFFAERYGVEVVGVTISREQEALARQRCRGLPVEIRFQDYREIDDIFDRIYSIGMFEHVGRRNHRSFMQVVSRCLAADGFMVLHTIGGNESATNVDPWMERYIFPKGYLPSAAQIAASAEGLLTIEDWHNFAQDYDRTLLAWHANIEAAWEDLPAHYDERFRRMWRYYLLACAGSFRGRGNQLWQVTFSQLRGGSQAYRPPGVR